MKRFLFTLTLIAAMAIGASAQKAQLQIGYGGYTMMDACDMHDGGPAVNTAWGAVTAGVNFKVAPKFSLGASYTVSSTARKHIESSSISYQRCHVRRAGLRRPGSRAGRLPSEPLSAAFVRKPTRLTRGKNDSRASALRVHWRVCQCVTAAREDE